MHMPQEQPVDSMEQQSHLLRQFGPCQRFSCSGVGLHKHRGRNQCHITSTAKLPARSSCEAETPLRPGQTTPDRVEMAVAKHEANPRRAAPRRTQHDESLCHASKTLTSCAVASPAGACKCSFSSCSSVSAPTGPEPIPVSPTTRAWCSIPAAGGVASRVRAVRCTATPPPQLVLQGRPEGGLVPACVEVKIQSGHCVGG